MAEVRLFLLLMPASEQKKALQYG